MLCELETISKQAFRSVEPLPLSDARNPTMPLAWLVASQASASIVLMALQGKETLNASSLQLVVIALEDTAHAEAAVAARPVLSTTSTPAMLHAACTVLVQQVPRHKHRPCAEFLGRAVEEGSASHSRSIGRASQASGHDGQPVGGRQAQSQRSKSHDQISHHHHRLPPDLVCTSSDSGSGLPMARLPC